MDDFVVGEVVHVELGGRGATYRIAKIWPDDPRLRSTDQGAPPAPSLDAPIAQRMRDVLRTAAVMAFYRVQRWDCDLVVDADDDEFAYGPSVQLVFRDASYVELPATWDGKSFRLADERERAYVAGKSEVTSATAVIRIVDDQRIYFVACTHLEFARVR